MEVGVWGEGEGGTTGVTAGVTLGELAGVATGVVGVGVGGGGPGPGAGAGAPIEGTARIEAHSTAGLTGATTAAENKHVSIHLNISSVPKYIQLARGIAAGIAQHDRTRNDSQQAVS